MERISLDQADDLFAIHMGLIIGPAATTATIDCFSEISSELAAEFSVPVGATYLDTTQAILGRNKNDSASLKEKVADRVSAFKGNPHLETISDFPWTGVISLAADTLFENQFSRATEKRVSGYSVTVIDDFPSQIPPKSFPVLKLIGTAGKDSFAISRATYTRKRPNWKSAVRLFIDATHSSSVMCLGVSSAWWIFADLVGEMLSDPKTTPQALLILSNDINEDQIHLIDQMSAGATQIVVIEATLAELSTRLKHFAKARGTPSLRTKPSIGFIPELAKYSDIVAVVNDQLSTRLKATTDRTQLIDLLFSPEQCRWDPFVFDMDFRRDLGIKIFDRLRNPKKRNGTDPLCTAIVGTSASGKTTLAKRLAFDIAKKGNLVIWVKKCFLPNVQSLFQQLSKVIADKYGKKQVYIFLDDPLSFRAVSLSNLAYVSQGSGIHCHFIVTVRQSDWQIEGSELCRGTNIADTFILEDQLSELEMGAFPNYLVSLETYKSKEEAKQAVATLSTQFVRDTLGILYFTLQGTRRSIAHSIKDEFHRLASRDGFAKLVTGAIDASPNILKDAYAMVAVAEAYGSSLPVEILVSALGVSYATWLNAIRPNGPAWGILYPNEEEDEGFPASYKTRNEIVNQHILEAVNGGRIGHGGEVAILRKLLKACDGVAPVYREFCLAILVPCKKLDKLGYLEGLSLFDIAIEALPFPDRTLKHQRGIWLREKGQNARDAIAAFEDALLTQPYAYSGRIEADEHIHTSIAAALLDEVESGHRDIQDSLPDIMRHLDMARSESFFNARAVHVNARTALRLVKGVSKNDGGDSYAIINQAIVAVDSTLMVLKGDAFGGRENYKRDIDYLEDIESKVYLEIADAYELEQKADELWEKHSRQEGFVLRIRRLYHEAKSKGRGHAFNTAYQVSLQVLAKIRSRSVTPSPDLAAAIAIMYFDWFAYRGTDLVVEREVKWQFLGGMIELAFESNRYKSDPLYIFIYAVMLAQVDRWTDADQYFNRLRNCGIPANQFYSIRTLLVDEKCIRRRVQGVVTGSENRLYFRSDDLGRDFRIGRSGDWPPVGQTAHAYIGFAFSGAIAISQI